MEEICGFNRKLAFIKYLSCVMLYILKLLITALYICYRYLAFAEQNKTKVAAEKIKIKQIF